jgi:hypothetical protein
LFHPEVALFLPDENGAGSQAADFNLIPRSAPLAHNRAAHRRIRKRRSDRPLLARYICIANSNHRLQIRNGSSDQFIRSQTDQAIAFNNAAVGSEKHFIALEDHDRLTHNGR